MGFWSINPYVGCAFGCAYCYARYAHRYTAERLNAGDAVSLPTDDLPPWLAFERRILVKREAPLLARKALARPALRNALRTDTVVIGTATDPYQPAERRFRLTRGILEVLAEQRGLSITIITKSPLVTRDIDVLTRLKAAGSHVAVNVSLITADRELARRLEPRAPTPEARLRAMSRLTANGIEVGVNCMPVLPGITDSPDQIEELVQRVAANGAGRATSARGALPSPEHCARPVPAVHRRGIPGALGAVSHRVCAQLPGRGTIPERAPCAVRGALRRVWHRLRSSPRRSGWRRTRYAER